MAEKLSIITEVKNNVGIVRLNRPQALNALNNKILGEIMDALEGFDADESTGAMVITGSDRAFAAGADVKEMADKTAVEMLLEDRIALFDRIQTISKPIIAAVSGYCLGGGNELAMSCDMIIASETARFGQPEITLGVIPGAGGTQRLARTVGKAVTMEMILNNRMLSAVEARQFGLVNKVVPVEDYLDEAVRLGGEIAERAPVAIRLAKETINRAFETSLTDGIADERRAFYFLFSTSDQKEGMSAFIEKRDPDWKGG
jgi:enoyl-CoA hydratase